MMLHSLLLKINEFVAIQSYWAYTVKTQNFDKSLILLILNIQVIVISLGFAMLEHLKNIMQRDGGLIHQDCRRQEFNKRCHGRKTWEQ